MKRPDLTRLRRIVGHAITYAKWELPRLRPVVTGLTAFFGTAEDAAGLTSDEVRLQLQAEDRHRLVLEQQAEAVRAQGGRDVTTEDEDLPRARARCLALRQTLRERGQLP